MLRVNGFFGHIQRNHLRSMAMFFGFAIACQLIGVAILFGPLLLFDRAHEPLFAFPAYVERYGLGVFLASSALFLVRFFLHVSSVRDSVDFEIVTVSQEPRLGKIIEIQAIAAGIAVPEMGVIENQARNAFACGLSQKSAVIVVTGGLLCALDDDELEAVVAHEITHIVNGDIQLMAVANVMLTTLFLLKKSNPVRLFGDQLFFLYFLLPPLLILYLVTGFINRLGITLAKLSRLLIASSREFIADAEAVRMTKNPAALVSALKCIEGRSEIEGLDITIDAMMIDGAVEGAFASHPTIAERIKVLSHFAGAMALGSGVHKDTRTSAEIAASTGGIADLRFAVSSSIKKAPDSSMIKRVSVGAQDRTFGLSSRNRNYVILAMCTPFLFTAFISYQEKSAAKALGGDSKKISGSKYARSNVSYSIAPRFKAISSKPPARSPANSQAKKLLPHNDIRKLASRMRAKELLNVNCLNQESHRNSAGKAVPNAAVIQYMQQRKNTLAMMSQFYDKNGLKQIPEFIGHSRSKKVPDPLNKRAYSADNANQNDRFIQFFALLAGRSQGFAPCYAGAVDGLSKPKTVAKAKNRLGPTLINPLIKTSLRGSN